MPLREFECTACGRAFESLIRHAHEAEDEKDLECPACRGRKVRRLLSAPAAMSSSGQGGGGGGCRSSSGFT